jgi:hypothetical protein
MFSLAHQTQLYALQFLAADDICNFIQDQDVKQFCFSEIISSNGG